MKVNPQRPSYLIRSKVQTEKKQKKIWKKKGRKKENMHNSNFLIHFTITEKFVKSSYFILFLIPFFVVDFSGISKNKAESICYSINFNTKKDLCDNIFNSVFSIQTIQINNL